MTTHVPMARVPFAPLDNPRLQHLASAKNRQNGLSSIQSTQSGKSPCSFAPLKPITTSKRSLEATIYDEFDSENVDPAMLSSPSKKFKNSSNLEKPFTFSMPVPKPMLPPSSRLSTPLRNSPSILRTPLTAPSGRSPKRRTPGIGNPRRISAPFTRIDPPFMARKPCSLPFSLDEALNAPLLPATTNKPSAGATIQESMPKTWFFDIYEDTPEEEAANLMEHSTLTLDLSSDDESEQIQKYDRGKENTPPEGYDASAASRPASRSASAAPLDSKKTEIVRKKVATEDMDDGGRSPLSDLETDPFIPEGLTKDAHVLVDESAPTSSKLSLDQVFAKPVAFTAGFVKPLKEKTSNLAEVTILADADSDVQSQGIQIYEDDGARTDVGTTVS